MKDAIQYANSHFTRSLDEFQEFLRIPSISTDPAFADEVRRCALWLRDHIKEIGIDSAKLIETERHPLVYAEYTASESAPTVLIYCHYDVQPPDPIDLWESPPFEPTIKDNTIFARGASDDKGQAFLVLKAIEAVLKTEGALPCNLKILFEGEEESGSVGIQTYVENNASKLAADVALVCDTAMISDDIPAITVSLRGIAYAELLLTGSDRDLHSGVYGGGVENPLHLLSGLIAGLHDEKRRITIPGFYDNVRALSNSEREMLRKLPFDEKNWLGEVGITQAATEEGYSVLEATTTRPTLDVNGVWGGYMGEGAKTVIPAKAGAKISCRLVPEQTPLEVFQGLRNYFGARIHSAVSYELRQMNSGAPILVDTEHPAISAATKALHETFGCKPFFARQGGSIPIVAMFKETLGLDTVLMGFALESDSIHAPNEKFGLSRFRKGVESVIRFFEKYPEHHKA
jgi:acetylornithine deacetylase/succinyl-diaminopimelate desuccinylase-like protein